MLLHHRHQTWTFLLDKNGRSSNIEWMLGLDINRTWLFLHHSVKGGSSDYTQWSLLCAPARFARNVKSFYFRHDLESTTDRTLAVVTSLATVLNRTFQTRSSSASSIIDKCPQFVSKEKRQNRIFGKAGVNKKAVTRQRHNFELKQYFQIKYCNHSMELIWGVAPQAYQCTCKYFK